MILFGFGLGIMMTMKNLLNDNLLVHLTAFPLTLQVGK